MKRDERNRAMEALKNDPRCEVLLGRCPFLAIVSQKLTTCLIVSLKAGGVGLTLTAARRVYIMDPYWYVESCLVCNSKLTLLPKGIRRSRIKRWIVSYVLVSPHIPGYTNTVSQHRLGQTRPVVAIKYIIENSIEQRLLEVQKTKAELANLTLGKPLNKQELQDRRMKELNTLLR